MLILHEVREDSHSQWRQTNTVNRQHSCQQFDNFCLGVVNSLCGIHRENLCHVTRGDVAWRLLWPTSNQKFTIEFHVDTDEAQLYKGVIFS